MGHLLRSAMDVPDGYTEVLIAGAGPAGYMAAVTLARYGISFRIIDTKPLCIQRGHASGMFYSLTLV